MALTTSDELSKQLTVIFGFNGQLQTEVGHIIGIGKLSSQHTDILIKAMLNYLNSYNAMLRDYAGCELYSIEFELENLEKDTDQTKILPRGMLFIPGEYKDCNTLLLLCSNEMSLLDNTKAKDSIDMLSETYFEVEEAINRTEISPDQRRAILENFAKRFSLKLQGNVIDGKWNRKLVGMKISEGKESEAQNYLTIHMKKSIRADKMKEIAIGEPKFTTPRLEWSPEDQFEFLKHAILPSAANVIAQNTFKLSANLLQIANTGTVDDLQQNLLIIFLNAYVESNKISPKVFSMNAFRQDFLIYLKYLREISDEFKQRAEGFCKSGSSCPFDELIDTLLKSYPAGQTVKEKTMNYLGLILKSTLKKVRYANPKKIRASELISGIEYTYQSAQTVIRLMHRTIPRYFQQYLLMNHASQYIRRLNEAFQNQRKPVMALGLKYIAKFADFLSNRVAYASFFVDQTMVGSQTDSKQKIIPGAPNGNVISKSQETMHNIEILEIMTQEEVLVRFKTLVSGMIEQFIAEVEINTEDLLGFVEIMMAEVPLADPHIKKLKRFKADIEFLWNMILRYSTINRFLIDLDPEVQLDPEQFSKLFLEFLRKRLGAVDIIWREYVFHWIDEYSFTAQQQYLADREIKKIWPKQKIIEDFIKYMDDRVEVELSIEGFKKPMREYLDKFLQQVQNRILTEIPKSYDMSLEIIQQFPDYIRQLFLKEIDGLGDLVKNQSPIVFIGPIPSVDTIFQNENSPKEVKILGTEGSAESMRSDPIGFNNKVAFQINSPTLGKEGYFERLPFYDYIIQSEMKFFSKLLAKPTLVELRTTNNQSFRGKELIHSIDIKYWEKFLKVYLSTNYLKVKPRF